MMANRGTHRNVIVVAIANKKARHVAGLSHVLMTDVATGPLHTAAGYKPTGNRVHPRRL